MRKVILLGMLGIASGVFAASEPVFSYGTYLVKGAFQGDYNTVLRDQGEAKIRARRADGTIIAETKVSNPNIEGCNFVLEIPVASASTTKACAIGETLDGVLITPGEGEITAQSCLKVASPTKVGVLNINCVKTTPYTNPKDGTVVEIPVAYIEEVEWYLGSGAKYDPWADYDNDGVINYEEYKAGTNPFDDSDRLKILTFRPNDGKFEIAFESVGGHVYAISAANTLANPDWMKRNVRKTKDGVELDQVYSNKEDGEPDAMNVFITPVAGSKQEFFKLEAK